MVINWIEVNYKRKSERDKLKLVQSGAIRLGLAHPPFFILKKIRQSATRRIKFGYDPLEKKWLGNPQHRVDSVRSTNPPIHRIRIRRSTDPPIHLEFELSLYHYSCRTTTITTEDRGVIWRTDKLKKKLRLKRRRNDEHREKLIFGNKKINWSIWSMTR